MGDKLLEYGKNVIKRGINNFKNKIVTKIFTNPYVLAGLAVAFFVVIVFFAITGATGSAEAAENDSGMQSATGSSWEQFLRYVAIKEGGGTDGDYYVVEDDGAGNPTVGHGLCLKSGDGYLHVAEFQKYGIDSKSLTFGDKVSKEICDAIWGDHIKGLYDGIASNFSDLTQYQCYALTDVKYRRGNINGFQTEYDSKWTSSDDQYGNYNEANESFSTDTLYNFFWNGGHSLEGVNTRKKDQWVLFKYGYYRPLKEYWQESTAFSGDLYNNDGSVNESKVETLLRDLESYFGLPSGKVSTSWQNTSVSGYNPTKEANSLNTMWGPDYNYQCTWWANIRANYYLTQNGKNKLPSRRYGHGKEVATTLKQYFNSGSTPKPNSVFSMTNCGSGYGHVAYVEAVDTVNGYYYVSHCGSRKVLAWNK